MRKKEYIEKYGQEAWDRKCEKTRIWKQNHPNYKPPKQYKYSRKKEDYVSKYGEDAWNTLLEKARKWKTDNRDKHIESVKQWQKDNKEKATEYKKRWKDNNPKETRAQNILDSYRGSDIKNNRGECTLTQKWIMDNIFSSNCIYCGDSNWKHLGCDRIDNSKPHTPDNVVCSCGICNVERGDRYTIEEFVEHRKTHPRDENPKQLQEVVEINGVKVIRKVL